MGSGGDGEWGRWGILDISQNPIIQSILTHKLSITFLYDLFYGDTKWLLYKQKLNLTAQKQQYFSDNHDHLSSQSYQ